MTNLKEAKRIASRTSGISARANTLVVQGDADGTIKLVVVRLSVHREVCRQISK